MPARRLPWFKLWPEAMRHEKVVLLSDGAFRTWIVTLAAGAEQSTRWRFASVTHLVTVTGRPDAEVRELIGAKLLDITGAGEVWVHDWRQWQDRYASDLAPRADGQHSANTPRTLRNGSANIPAKLPGELRGESKELREQTETPPKPPPQAEGALTPPTDGDRELWSRTLAALCPGLLEANAAKLAALELLGRAEDGGLRLRAPPGTVQVRHWGPTVAQALFDAGDQAAGRVATLEG